MSVIDTGIGISEEGIKKLFIDFAKLDENSKRNT
jgi:signal transduction histidine kinase